MHRVYSGCATSISTTKTSRCSWVSTSWRRYRVHGRVPDRDNGMVKILHGVAFSILAIIAWIVAFTNPIALVVVFTYLLQTFLVVLSVGIAFWFGYNAPWVD